MADYTENYNLKKPDRTDFYSVQDFNDNADIIDTALNDKLNKDFSNVSSGAVPIANGGTGATTAANALSNLGVTTALNNKADKDLSNVTVTLPITKGGTGATTAANALSNLGVTTALNNKADKDLSNVTVTLPITKGGTGATTAANALSNLGVTTALNNKADKDLSNVTGTLPIAKGGTGATTAANALSNLGALPLVGGTLTGDLRLKPANSNYGSKINFGDGDYAYIKENTDDNLEIKAKNINFAVTSGYDKLTVSTNADPTSSQKKALFTSAGNINTDLVKNYGIISGGWLQNQNVLTYISSLESPQCGFFGTEGCTGTPNDTRDYWFMSLIINNGQKTLFANSCLDINSLTCETWINQRWYINGSNTWCGWRKILTSPANTNVGVTYVVSSTPSTAQNNDLWAW